MRRDLVEAAARVLTEDSHLGRAYDFTGGLNQPGAPRGGLRKPVPWSQLLAAGAED
ncbi:hypothetical protein [Streptomyces galbus]|uniref:hypothetical protein n=1 Tax=Streptomyces galbus TaxID=33898 RepID=UPI001FF83F6D|nr:hypothetical protein [Streptomyces galbus]